MDNFKELSADVNYAFSKLDELYNSRRIGVCCIDLNKIPQEFGVYCFADKHNRKTIRYVGIAKDLFKRFKTQHLYWPTNDKKTHSNLQKNVCEIEVIQPSGIKDFFESSFSISFVTLDHEVNKKNKPSQIEFATLIEALAILAFSPKYNIEGRTKLYEDIIVEISAK